MKTSILSIGLILISSFNLKGQLLCYKFDLDSVVSSIPSSVLENQTFEISIQKKIDELDSLKNQLQKLYDKRFDGCPNELLVMNRSQKLEVLYENIADLSAMIKKLKHENEIRKKEKTKRILVEMIELYRLQNDMTAPIYPEYLYVDDRVQVINITKSISEFIADRL